MFKKLLFATSATPACDHAARVAFDMARRYNAHLDVFHVIGVPTRGYSQVVVDLTTGEQVALDDNYRDLVKEEIHTYYEHQIRSGVAPAIEVAIGEAHREILRMARQSNPDMIIMGGSTGAAGAHAARRNITGSTFQRVAKAAHCPVMVINRPAGSFWGGFSNIVFGTDFSESADAAFAFALALARAFDCELHILHALDITGCPLGAFQSQDDVDDRIREAFRTIRYRYLSRLEAFKNYETQVWEGIPFVEIVKYAREKQADLIVMGHHTRKAGDGEDALGSVVEQVILRANCPVISINRSVSR